MLHQVIVTTWISGFIAGLVAGVILGSLSALWLAYKADQWEKDQAIIAFAAWRQEHESAEEQRFAADLDAWVEELDREHERE